MNWNKRGAKVLGSFFTGYGAGFASMIPANMAFAPGELNWVNIVLLPLVSGMVVTFPQIGKIFNEFGSMGEQGD